MHTACQKIRSNDVFNKKNRKKSVDSKKIYTDRKAKFTITAVWVRTHTKSKNIITQHVIKKPRMWVRTHMKSENEITQHVIKMPGKKYWNVYYIMRYTTSRNKIYGFLRMKSAPYVYYQPSSPYVRYNNFTHTGVLHHTITQNTVYILKVFLSYRPFLLCYTDLFSNTHKIFSHRVLILTYITAVYMSTSSSTTIFTTSSWTTRTIS